MTGPIAPALDSYLAWTTAHQVPLLAANTAAWGLVVAGWVLGRLFGERKRR